MAKKKAAGGRTTTESAAEMAAVPVADVGAEIRTFVRKVESLARSLPGVMLASQSEAREASERFNDYAKQYGTVVKQNKGVTTYSFKPPYDVRSMQLRERRSQADAASDLLPQVFLLALVGQFDAFLGRLLRALFLMRPELIEASERSLTFAQLIDLGTIEAAREYLLEKEIETVLRKSHAEQFTWMENKFKVELRKDLPSWPVFVELTERRNLFAHTSGVVSDQYLANCREHGAELQGDCCRGTELTVDPAYFRAAQACVFEIGVKLAQVLWRKLVPGDIEKADDSLNEVAFNLIVSERYRLAIELLDFGCCTLKKHSSDLKRKVLQVNRAQAYKWSGDEGTMSKILDGEDWSAAGLDFRLAIAVLRDDFHQAAQTMKAMGRAGDVNESAYQEWPLFKSFRQSEDFADAYEAVFGEPFVHLETTLKASELERRKAIIDKLKASLEEMSPEDVEIRSA